MQEIPTVPSQKMDGVQQINGPLTMELYL
jgi:hypothetical protein